MLPHCPALPNSLYFALLSFLQRYSLLLLCFGQINDDDDPVLNADCSVKLFLVYTFQRNSQSYIL